jgi:hypothetical protein
VVDVAAGGTLVMESGAITGARNIGGGTGGVRVQGSFTMKGGSIYDNQPNGSGGGVLLYGSAVFTMTGGTIYNNRLTYDTGNGGGVYIDTGCTFNLNLPATTASIYGNATVPSIIPTQVYNNGGTFLVNGSPGSNY